MGDRGTMTRAEIFTPSVRSDPDDADFVKTEGFSSIKKETRTLRKRMHRFGGHDDADGWRTADLGGGRSDCSRGCVRWQPGSESLGDFSTEKTEFCKEKVRSLI